MSRFSLLNKLNEESTKLSEQTDGYKITYQQYNITVNNKEVGVLIPVRECNNFETTLSAADTLTNYKLKKILREHRGIFVRDR